MSSSRAISLMATSPDSLMRCWIASRTASARPSLARRRPMTSSSSNPPRRLGEFAMIAKLFAPLAAGNPGALGLSDDAATVQVPSDQELVVTKDMLVEGVHFLRDDPPDLLAKKALRVNLSDLAAKGATAKSYLLGLSLATWIGDEWLAQ